MKHLGFVPNSAARRLRKQKTETIAVLVPRITNPFFSRFIEAIEIAASEHKYKLIICQTRYLPEKEMEYLQLLSTKQVDGIILCSLENPWEDVEPYLQHGPIVLCNEYIEEANVPTVKFDHAQGAYIAAKHVLEQGYRNLIFCRGNETKVVSQQRKMGFLRAITEKSRQVEAIDFLENAFSWDDGKRIFHEVLKDKKILPRFWQEATRLQLELFQRQNAMTGAFRMISLLLVLIIKYYHRLQSQVLRQLNSQSMRWPERLST